MRWCSCLSLLTWLLLGWITIGQAATVRGVIVDEQGQPVDEAEVFLVAEGSDYGEYQFVTGGTFVFIDVSVGDYMLYARQGDPPEDPDRQEAPRAVEIKKEEQVYAIELRLKPPYRVKSFSSPELKQPKASKDSGAGSP